MLHYKCGSRVNDLRKRRLCLKTALNYLPKRTARKCVYDVIDYLKTTTMQGTVSASSGPSKQASAKSAGSNHHHHHYHHNSYFSNSEQLKLLNCDEKSIHWFIECLCFGVQFTLGDLTDDIATDDDVDRELERMKSSVGVCCEWLSCLSSEQCAGLSSAFSSMTIDQASTAAVAPAQIHHRLTNIPNVFQKNPLKFYDQILWALSQVFLPTRSTALSLVANRRILNWKVLHCKKILRLAEALLQSPAPQLMSDRNEYTNVLMFVLSIADNVLSTKNDLADSLNAYLIMSVFRIWLAACEQCFPLTECWQTFREMLKTWTHHGYVYCQWSQICLAMTVDMYNVCWQMSEFTRHKYEAPYAISDPECLCNAWLRFIQLIDDPGDLIAFERRTCGVFGICGTTGTMAAGSDGTAAKSAAAAAASLSSITTTTSTITTTGTLDLVMKHCCEMLNNLLISDQRKRSSVNMLFKLFGPWLFKISAQSLSEKSQSMAIELICRMVSSIQPDEYIDRKYLAITLSILHSACSSFKFAPAKAVIAFISNSPEMLCSYVPLGFLLAIFALALKCVHVTVTRYMFNAGPKKTNESESQLVLRAVTSFLRIGTGFLFRHKRWVMIPTMDGSVSWDRLMADLGEVTCSMMFISSLELNDLHSLCASVNLILTNFTIANGVRPRRRRQKKFSFDFAAWTDQMIRVLVAKLNNQLADNYVCASLCFNLLNVFTFTRSTAHFALIIDCCRRYCILQLEKESYRHVRDMHTAIVDAYECCTRWIVELLNKQGDNRDCVAFEHMDEIISELQKMVEMGLSGHRNQPPPPAPPPPRPLKSVSSSNSLTTASLVSVSSNHKKPASIRVKKAAEHLLAFGLFRGFDMVDMNDAMHSRFRKVAAVTFMSHPQHVITLSADPDNLRKVGILIRTVFGCCEWKIEYRQKPRNSDRIKTPRILLKESKLMNRRPPKNIPAKYSTKRFEQLSSASSAATFLTLDDLNPIEGLQYIPSSMFEHFREPPIAKVNVGQPPKPNFVRIMLAQSTLFTLHIIRNTEQRRRQRRERLNVSRTTTTGLNTDLDTVAFFANLSDENLQSAFEYLDRIPRKIKADCLVLNESSFRPSLNPFDSEVIKVPRIELCDERDSLCGVRILFSAKNSPEFCSSHPLISRPLVSVYWLDDLASPTTNNASSSNNNLFADNNKLSSTNNEQCPVSVEIWRRNGIIFHIDCVDQEASKYWLSITIVNGILVNETAFPKALSAFIADLYHKHRRSNPLANTRNTSQRTQSGQFASKSGIQFRKLKLIELANRFTENPMNPLTIHKLCLNRTTFHL